MKKSNLFVGSVVSAGVAAFAVVALTFGGTSTTALAAPGVPMASPSSPSNPSGPGSSGGQQQHAGGNTATNSNANNGGNNNGGRNNGGRNNGGSNNGGSNNNTPTPRFRRSTGGGSYTSSSNAL